MSIEKELEKFLEGFKSLADELLEKTHQKENDDDEVLDQIGKEYDDFMKWAVGSSGFRKQNKDICIANWTMLHPNIPVPRIFFVKKNVNPEINTVALFIDAYAYYLDEKSQE